MKSTAKITRDDIQFKKIKLLDKGGISAEYIKNEPEDDGIAQVTCIIEHPGQRHPDVDKAFKPLALMLGMNYHMFSAALMVRDEYSKVFTDKKKSKQPAEDAYNRAKEEVLEKIEVTGISLTGQEEMAGVVISGKIDGLAGNSAMNTSNIILDRDTHGFEQDLQDHIELIQDEVFEFLFNKKRSQLELAFDDDLSDVGVGVMNQDHEAS